MVIGSRRNHKCPNKYHASIFTSDTIDTPQLTPLTIRIDAPTITIDLAVVAIERRQFNYSYCVVL